MRHPTQIILAAVALTLGATLPTAASALPSSAAAIQEKQTPAAPALGSIVDYTFRESPMNSIGVKALADLRGKPLLIEFWGVR